MPDTIKAGELSVSPLTPFSRVAHRRDGTHISPRILPEETAIALSYGGTTHAVMMATPADLEDFAIGFSLTEGIISSIDEIESLKIQDLKVGFDIQVHLKDSANRQFEARRRRLAGPVGCGLCGIESIEEAMRKVPLVSSSLQFQHAHIIESVRLLSEKQVFNHATGAVHAAGLYIAGSGIIAAREDVGRHNALDKLAGALARKNTNTEQSVLVITSRVSVEMVQKAAAIGVPIILAISAPTALAVRTAEAADITLVALVRGEEYDIFTHRERIIGASDHGS